MNRALRALAIVAALLVAAVAWAKPPKAFSQHVAEGRRLYAEKNYDQALTEFDAAYQIDADPRLLLNIGRCHYMADRPREALDVYKQMLKLELPREVREEVLSSIARTTIRLAEKQQQQPQPMQLAVTSAAPAVPAKEPEKPLYKKGWFWAIIGGVAVAGLAVGLGVGLRPVSSMPDPNPDDVIPVM